MSEHLWALVLAAGEGSRIRHLTTDANGRSVPKQYASLDGNSSMLRRTLDRAERIVPRERVAVVVARQHEDFWGPELADLSSWNVIVQPRNRGTGTGLLLGLFHLRFRDPQCEALVLPSDHHVSDEDALRHCLLQAVEHAAPAGAPPTLVGVAPERDRVDLGWILARNDEGSSIREVVGFLEKPEPSVADRLAAQGALVNSMILAAGTGTLLGLFRDTVPRTVDLLEQFLAADGLPDQLDTLYEALPPCDLSRDVLARAAERLAVVPSPPCGWTDIGTPARLHHILGHTYEGSSRVA